MVPDVMAAAGAEIDKRPVRGGFCEAVAPSRWGPQPGRGTVADGGAAGVGATGFDDFRCKTPFLSFRDGTRTCSGARRRRRLTVWHRCRAAGPSGSQCAKGTVLCSGRARQRSFQLAFRYCGEERVRPVFGHDPNDRPEPASLTIFDFTNGFVMLMLVDSLGFSVIVSSSAGSGSEIAHQPINTTIV